MPSRPCPSSSRLCTAETLECRTLFDGLQTVSSFTPATTGDRPTTMVNDAAGNLFGTTFEGGANGVGTIWEVTAGQTHQLLVVAPFTNGPEGGTPISLVIDPQGNLFGTTITGGANGE